LFLSDFIETFSLQISGKNIEISNFMKIWLVGAELFRTDGRTDGQTDMTMLLVAFRNFANLAKNEWTKIKKYLEECA
jgi:hypothetical protein